VTLKLHEVETAKLLESSERLEATTQLAMIKAVRPAAEALVRAGLPGDDEVAQPSERKVVTDVVAAAPEGPDVLAGKARMAALPGGTYIMGATKRSARVQPFLLDVTEVTVAAYGECVEAGRCSAAFDTVGWAGMTDQDRKQWSEWSRYCNRSKRDRADHPINCVDWRQATAYCAAVGKRLPTEEEWEWAARGAERGTTYPWGDDPPRGDQLCWNGGERDRIADALGTCAVGGHPMADSPHAVKDLAGNVWEWTSRVNGHRGGDWSHSDPAMFSAAYRSMWDHPEYRNVYIGFRCAKDAR
jgi:formylglycine-generating enzyme required for sulfatase activity